MQEYDVLYLARYIVAERAFQVGILERDRTQMMELVLKYNGFYYVQVLTSVVPVEHGCLA